MDLVAAHDHGFIVERQARADQARPIALLKALCGRSFIHELVWRAP
jgi:hypothetical protein